MVRTKYHALQPNVPDYVMRLESMAEEFLATSEAALDGSVGTPCALCLKCVEQDDTAKLCPMCGLVLHKSCVERILANSADASGANVDETDKFRSVFVQQTLGQSAEAMHTDLRGCRQFLESFNWTALLCEFCYRFAESDLD